MMRKQPSPGTVMPTFAHQFKGEVSRLAKKEVKAETQSLKKATAVESHPKLSHFEVRSR